MKPYLKAAAFALVSGLIIAGLLTLITYSLPVSCYSGAGSPCAKSFWQK